MMVLKVVTVFRNHCSIDTHFCYKDTINKFYKFSVMNARKVSLGRPKKHLTCVYFLLFNFTVKIIYLLFLMTEAVWLKSLICSLISIKMLGSILSLFSY